MKLSYIKLLSALIGIIFAVIYAMPNFANIDENSWLPNQRVNLGLDLRGGSHLLLEVDFDQYLRDQLEILSDYLRKEFREKKLGYRNLMVKENQLSFTMRNIDDFEKIRQSIRKVERLTNIEQKNEIITISYDITKLDDLRNNVFEQSIEIIRRRIDSTGTKEPIIQKQGTKHILLQVPGEEDPTFLKNILGQTAKLTFHIVDDATIDSSVKNIPHGSMIVTGKHENGEEYSLLVKNKAVLTGDMLKNAQASFNQESQSVVHFSLNNIGAKLFGEVTKANSGKRLAIILDNRLISAPMINEPILGGSGIISGNFTLDSAKELALLLRAGALPAPLKIIEERSIGPNLGADSIEAGKKAGLIGFISVAVFMIWAYGVLGIFANVALIVALTGILAMLSLFQATLTLPGIAGIILTIGMAVDANVLIYERIREELKKGVSNLYAIRQGFETAFATIADSNVTTLIAALMLYIFGTGAVKGFAVTLAIGIMASMFSAIIITKLLVDIWMIYIKPKNLGI